MILRIQILQDHMVMEDIFSGHSDMVETLEEKMKVTRNATTMAM